MAHVTGKAEKPGEWLEYSPILTLIIVAIGLVYIVNIISTLAPIVGIYSALLGFFLPSGGGKWIVEAPYVLQAAQQLHVNMGWIVQVYNASEALPNFINPFWMLPLMGLMGVKARDLAGYSMLQ